MFHKLEIAKLENVRDIYALYEQRVQWMDSIGLQQWNATDYLNVYPLTYYQDLQRSGSLYMLRQNKQMIGALALLKKDTYWPDCDTASAYYIHHLVSDRNCKGAGKFMLEQAEKIAVNNGKRFLRLDCAIDNTALNQYYQKLGYIHVGICQDGPYIGNRLEKELTSYPTRK